jgi:D-alanyl-D-alanine carboxypeptidase
MPLRQIARNTTFGSRLVLAIVAGVTFACVTLAPARAAAEALLLVEADSGKVLHAENATYPWYPASVTKLMTAYSTLRAVKEGRITLDTVFTVSPNAVAQAPTKMGFGVGTQVTVDNALKMLMVKSANDMAVLLAEGVSGSIDKFADEMNRNARRLGMTQTNYVNPNGLPADEQITSARDLAILARALIREFPEYDYYWHLPGIRLGKRVIRNYNTLLGRYPGTDGMKTGFICAAGFNLVATATRDGKRLIAVVLGAPSSAVRAVRAAQLLERGFGTGPLSWLTPSLGTVDALQPINADPPNLREQMCGSHRKRPAAEEEEDDIAANSGPDSPYAVFLQSLHPQHGKGVNLLQEVRLGDPVPVFTGPPKGSAQLAAVDPKAKATGKPAPAMPTKPAKASVAGAPWNNLSPAALAASPPAAFSAAAGGVDAVPLPRARPKLIAQTAPASTPAKPATAKPAIVPSAQKPAAKPQKTSQAAPAKPVQRP